MRRIEESAFLLTQSPTGGRNETSNHELVGKHLFEIKPISRDESKPILFKSKPRITSRRSESRLDDTRRTVISNHCKEGKEEKRKNGGKSCGRPHSWYGYGTILEEGVRLNQGPDPGGTVAEEASLLEGGGRARRVGVVSPPQAAASSNNQIPHNAHRRRCFLDLRLVPSTLKSLIGRRASRGNSSPNPPEDVPKPIDKPVIKIDMTNDTLTMSKSNSFSSNINSNMLHTSNNMLHTDGGLLKPNKSANNLKTSDSASSTSVFKSSSHSVNMTHINHKLWSIVPLLKREGGSCASLSATVVPNEKECLRKCETVLALTNVSNGRPKSLLEPLRPINRLRSDTSESKLVLSGSSEGLKLSVSDKCDKMTIEDLKMCSRCSSLLSLASGSRYSLAGGGGGFVSVTSVGVDQTPVVCKLCLTDVLKQDCTTLEQCGCTFCTDCMRSYVQFEVLSGAYAVSCPDAECPVKGALAQVELRNLGGSQLLHKHNQYRLNREIDLDATRTWCPRAGCETICEVGDRAKGSPSGVDSTLAERPFVLQSLTACSVHCPTCSEEFCSGCKKQWHPGVTCDQHAIAVGDGFPLLLDGDTIKGCPLCSVPIEKDEGCAQMMCKRCKHVFCWYCLASLDDDFLLRHYDKGPCKNKLGHSRASVIWHRTQVIGIFAGFGILLLVASPLLLLAAPCIVCCKCRVCSGATRLETEDETDDS